MQEKQAGCGSTGENAVKPNSAGMGFKGRWFTGTLTLPWAKLSYSVNQVASRTFDFALMPLLI
jgi:hypothetical protein